MTSSNYCLLPAEMTVGKVNNFEGNPSHSDRSRRNGSARSSRMGSAGSSRESDNVSFFLTHRPSTANNSSSINKWRVPPGTTSTIGNTTGSCSMKNGTQNADSRFNSTIDLPHLGLQLSVPGYKQDYSCGRPNENRPRRTGSARSTRSRGFTPQLGRTPTPPSSVFDSIPCEVIEGESYLRHLRDKGHSRTVPALQSADSDCGFSVLEQWQQFCSDHLAPMENELMISELEKNAVSNSPSANTQSFRKVFDYFVQYGEDPALGILNQLRSARSTGQSTPTVEASDDVPPPSGGMNPASAYHGTQTARAAAEVSPRVQRASRSNVLVSTHLVHKPQVSTTLNNRKKHLVGLLNRHTQSCDNQSWRKEANVVEVSNHQKLQVANQAREVLAACHAHHVQVKHISVLRSQQRAASCTNGLFHRHSTSLKAPVLRRRTTREEEGPGLAPSTTPVLLGSKVSKRVERETTSNVGL